MNTLPSYQRISSDQMQPDKALQNTLLTRFPPATKSQLPFIHRAILQQNGRHGLFTSRSVPSRHNKQIHSIAPGKALGRNFQAGPVVNLVPSGTRTGLSGANRGRGQGGFYLRALRAGVCHTILCTATSKLRYDVLKMCSEDRPHGKGS